MLTATCRRLFLIGGHSAAKQHQHHATSVTAVTAATAASGAFHSTLRVLSPKRKSSSPAAAGSSSASAGDRSSGAVAELGKAAKLRERSPTSVRSAAARDNAASSGKKSSGSAKGGSGGALSSLSSSIGRPLVHRRKGGDTHAAAARDGKGASASSNTLEPLKKLSDAEMDALHSTSAAAATEVARKHQRKTLQQVSLNLNSFLAKGPTTAATSSSSSAGAPATVTLSSSPSTSTGISSSSSTIRSSRSIHSYVPYVSPEDAATYDDGTVDSSFSSGDGSDEGGGDLSSGGSSSSVGVTREGHTFDFNKINTMNRMGEGRKGAHSRIPSSSSSSSPSPSSSSSSVGGNSQIIIDDGSGTLGASHLVFSLLNNRLLHRETPVVLSLLEIGFAVNEHSKELFLKFPDVLNEYAHAVRFGGIEIPKCWKGKMVTEVGYLLQNPRVEDPAAHVQRLIEAKKSSRRANIGMIASMEGSSSSASAAERAAQEESESANIVLNREQREVLDFALKGFSMYIGGSAGTGKTVLLTALKRRLTQEGLRVAMTATTGIAGCHIGGATFHHTFSVTATEEFANKKNLLSYDVVVIDEVSMMSRRLFEEFDEALRHEAGINIPFGGVQIILCGDFLQLSPVNEESIIASPLFTENFALARLVQQVRQSAFPEFANMLGQIRHGSCPPLLEQAIKALPEGTMAPDAINLLPTNIQVREANHKELARIDAPAFKMTPRVSEIKLEGEFTPTIMLQVEPNFNASKLLALAYDYIRERVQMRNPRGFSLYRLFVDGYAFRIALPQAESALWKRTMVARFLEMAPLIEKWKLGCTVHNIIKEGVGLHTAEYEESLSRLLKNHPVVQPQELKEGCRVLLRSNLTTTLVNGSVGVVKGFCPCEKEYVHSYLRADASVDSLIEEYNNYHKVELGYPATLPLVQFAEGMPPIAIPPASVTIGGTAATQYYALEGIAVPLTLAYAFTVHKVQGLTLVGRVHLELSKMWPCNHLLYVAMSRVKNPDQLSMSGFNPTMIVADDKSVAFDEALMSADQTITVPSTATVAVWKGFDTYSVTQDFHKSIGGVAGAAAAGAASVTMGSKGAAMITADAASSSTSTSTSTSTSAAASKGKKMVKGVPTSAVSRLKYEAENAKLVSNANSGLAADGTGADGSAASATGAVDETVFAEVEDGSGASSPSSSEAFLTKTKPASHHELLFQQMAQRGAGNYKYFTEGIGGGGGGAANNAAVARQAKAKALAEAKSKYISALSGHGIGLMGVKGGASSFVPPNAGTDAEDEPDYYSYRDDSDMPPM